MAAGTIRANFEVVTPLFLGGADPASTVELRPPSMKGILRFWWRALAWSRCGGDLVKIRKEEQAIFGAAGNDSGAPGQSSFGLRSRWLSEPGRLDETASRSLTTNRLGAAYLGYGVINRGQGNLPRPCYRPHGPFEITLSSLKPKHGESGLHPSLLDALKLFGLLGGLGGRSRRGWGSVTLTKLETENGGRGWEAPHNLVQYRDVLSSMLAGALGASEARYSGLGKGAQLHVFGVGVDALTVLDQLGQAYKAFRLQTENRSFIFGLPHSRFRGADRRASPLLFHVHKLQDHYAIAAAFLRAPFLEGQPFWNEYKVIQAFLDGLPATLKTKGLTQAFNIFSGGSSRG